MKRVEMLSGAPIFRGRWAAIFWLWASGFMAGDMDLGLVWNFIPDAAHVGHTHWGIDAALALGSLTCLVAGLFSIDQYGRNAWFAWAPDDVRWSELTRDSVNRKPVIRWSAWAYDWNQKRWWHQ